MLRALALIALVVAPAAADPRTAQLDYTGACSADALAARVRELVGRDPFTPAAPTTVAIAVTAGPPLHATLDIADGATPVGRRELDAPTCAELTTAMALVIAMSLDRPVADPPPAAPLPALPVLPAAPPVAPRRPAVFELLGGVAASFGGTPAGSLGARALRRDWSVELGFDLALPETHAMVDVSRGGGTFAVCRHLGPLALCPIANAGWIHGSGRGVAMVETATTPLVSVGGRLAVELQISHRFAVRARADGRVLLTSTAFTVDGATVWETPRGEGWFGIDLLARIP